MNRNYDVFGMFIVTAIACSIIAFSVISQCNHAWERACVKHGAASYNETSGQWQWKEPVNGNYQPRAVQSSSQEER